ncbi:U-scoloptoxin(11)-Sm5a-like [Chironomus tepperi]|uniref:U-scoloptoxin(11)-Sm5a-like n=1 Tax=Chironomus tepperi TaxID=113505 RepID=UPI00391F5C16
MGNLKYLIFLIFFCNIVCGHELKEKSDNGSVKICGQFDVCNIVYKPYFANNVVETLCKCPEGGYCSPTYDNDNRSLPINPRTQMKFCEPVHELISKLPECEVGGKALEITKFYYINQIKNISTKLLCGCDKNPVYWRHHSREGQAVPENEKLFKAFDYFECSDLRQCNTDEFCGLARSDYGFIFQRCTCNYTDDCRYYVEETDMEENIEELFYNDLFYKAHCLRKETAVDW